MKIGPPTGVAKVTVAQGVALIPPLIAVALANGMDLAAPLIAALVTVLIWENIFAAIRQRRISFHGVTTALVVTVFVPPDVAVWQLVLTLSLGVIVAEQIFGGRGFGFLSAATVSLALLVFSFPQVQLTNGTPTLALATVPGAVLLLALGLISWRVIVGALVGLGALLTVGGHAIDPIVLATAVIFGMVFLTCDPVAATSTHPGRWVYGALAAGLMILFAQGPVISANAVVFASLTASIFAPLIDHIVVLAHARRRKRWANA